MENNKSLSDYLFGLWAVFMHFIVLWGILDANFHSPVLRNLEIVKGIDEPSPPAKRLLLFVADGLRYRTFSSETPEYFKNIMENEGVWGISHTRVPTESRPGNVAIAAGLYEDPSALFKGWKENPVDFDSVFNQSSVTWAWGSPDIVPMFVKGARGNVEGSTYPHDWQDFDKVSNSPRRLDSWVFDQFDIWMKTSASSVKNKTGVILFFHLLGCDTAGHSSKPNSRDYPEEMEFVATKIEQTVERVNNYFGDNATSFIFTSDHGMTDWGSHGGGSEDETETPFVAWGAGIDRSNVQKDIKQADIAPLIASLLGISIPVNSEGILPSFFLHPPNSTFVLKSVIANIEQLLKQVHANMMLTSGESNTTESDIHIYKQLHNSLLNLKNSSEPGEALARADKLIVTVRDTLYSFRQRQTYQLVFYLTLLWIGWLILLIYKLIGTDYKSLVVDDRHTDDMPRHIPKAFLLHVFFLFSLFMLVAEHYASRRGDFRVLGYGVISFFSIYLAIYQIVTFKLTFKMSDNFHPVVAIMGTIHLILLMFLGILNKMYFSLAMLNLTTMYEKLTKKTDIFLIPTAVILAIFPLLTTTTTGQNLIMIILPLILTPVILLRKVTRNIIIVEVIRIILTILVILEVIDGRSFVSWLILFTTPLSIGLYDREPEQKLLGVIMGLLCPLCLLSASYEPQVFAILGIHLISLLKTMKNEVKPSYSGSRMRTPMDLRDLVTAVYFVLFVLLSFFGTGNMASISSFDPSWTRHFITIFSPFIMTSLILLKIGFPLILIGCASRVVVSSSTFLAVMLIGDFLSLPLMHFVNSEGSWLQIGTAISRYAISITLPCLFVVLYYISSPLMELELLRRKDERKDHLI